MAVLCNLEQDFIILYYRSGFIKFVFYLGPINLKRIYIPSEYSSEYDPNIIRSILFLSTHRY